VKILEDLYKSGRIKSVGVSNFVETNIDKLVVGAKVVPAVNQVELHPHLSQSALAAHCVKLGIAPKLEPVRRHRRYFAG